MIDDGVLSCPLVPAVDTSDALAVDRELERLAGSYPAFRFRVQQGWDRQWLRWVAERIEILDPGLNTVITTDLSELQAALSSTGDDASLGRKPQNGSVNQTVNLQT